MASLNQVSLIGNLTRDPELRHTSSGRSIAEISLAINRSWTNEQGQKQEEVTFVEVTFWGKQAETLQKYTHKGDPLYLEGRLQLDTWDDKETGKKRSKLRVVGENFQFLRSKDSSDRENRSTMTQEESSARARQRPAGSQSATSDDLDRPPEDDDIPF